MPHSKKGLGRCHKIGTGNNQVRRRTTPRDNRGFNCNDCHSKSINVSLTVISVSIPLNNSVINPPQLSSVCQQSSRSSHSIPRDNKCLDRNHINSKINELSSLVIPTLPPWNNPFNNPPQLSLFVNSHPALHLTQLISLWFNVIDIKSFVIIITAMWRPGWLMTNRGQLRWIDDRIIQWNRNRYHR